MPRLGLGLGLSRGSFIKRIDPRIQAAINANATMLLMADLANGTGPGNNTDPTSTWKDLINANDATLVNFAYTTSSGWESVVVPSGTEVVCVKDGVDDRIVIANNLSIDPTGTEDFAICGCQFIPSPLDSGWIFCKNELSNVSDVQFGIFLTADGGGRLRVGGVNIILAAATFVAGQFNSFDLKKIGSNIKLVVNETVYINQGFATSLVSRPNFNIGARSSSSDNTTHTEFTNYQDGYMVFFYNGATGLNETDVDNACALLRAPYF